MINRVGRHLALTVIYCRWSSGKHLSERIRKWITWFTLTCTGVPNTIAFGCALAKHVLRKPKYQHTKHSAETLREIAECALTGDGFEAGGAQAPLYQV